MIGQRSDPFLLLRCGDCGEPQDVGLCGNPGCPDRANACAGREGYCCRCFVSAVTVGATLVAGRELPEQGAGHQAGDRDNAPGTAALWALPSDERVASIVAGRHPAPDV